MDWTAIGAIATGIGSLGTVISLYFVSKQLKDIHRIQYATTVQNITTSERELWQMVLADDDMVKITATHLQFPEESVVAMHVTQKNILEIVLFLRQYENIYYQRKHGVLEIDLWEQWCKSMEFTFEDDRVYQVLEKAHVGFSEDFKDFIREDIRQKVISKKLTTPTPPVNNTSTQPT